MLYTVLGSTLMLVGILALVTAAGTADLSALAASRGAGLSRSTQVVVAALLLAGLGIKVPLWPVHTWLPPAHTIAPTAGSVLLAAVLLKMGTYGLVRLSLAPLPDGFAAVAPVLAVAGAIGIIWGGLACLVERDLKRLVAYSSVAHMGFVALGLASGTTHRAAGRALRQRRPRRRLGPALLPRRRPQGALGVAPTCAPPARPCVRWPRGWASRWWSASPPPSGCPGWSASGASSSPCTPPGRPRPTARSGCSALCAVLAVLGTGLAAAYSLRVLRTVWAGERTEPRLVDARGGELAVLAVLVLAVVALGVAPGPLLQTTIADATAITSPGSVSR